MSRANLIETVWAASQLHTPQVMLGTADVQALLADVFAAERKLGEARDTCGNAGLGRQAAREWPTR